MSMEEKLKIPLVSSIPSKTRANSEMLTRLGMEDARRDVANGTAIVKVTRHHDRGKLGNMVDFVSINTSPIINKSCESCEINDECYARRIMFTFRSNLCRRFGYNKHLFSDEVSMEEFSKFIPKIGEKIRMVRINSFGEIEDKQHAEKIVEIAKHYPSKRFTIYTRVDLFGIEKPENMCVIYSNRKPDDFSTVYEKKYYKDARFYLLYRDRNKIPREILDAAHECVGKCCLCNNCYSDSGKKIVISQVR